MKCDTVALVLSCCRDKPQFIADRCFSPIHSFFEQSHYLLQIKLASVNLAMKYMKRVSAELENVGGGAEEEELIIQGVRFAFRVHQVAEITSLSSFLTDRCFLSLRLSLLTVFLYFSTNFLSLPGDSMLRR